MKKIIPILIVIIVIITGAYFVLNKVPDIKINGVVVPGGQNLCTNDGICSIIVGEYEIIWNPGDVWPQEPIGTMDFKIQIGDEVSIYGKKLDKKTITIYGKKSYYIKKNISEK